MAATSEFEELRLSVVLVDEASAGLAALRSEMRNFNDDSIRFIRGARDSAEAYKRVGREAEEVVKGLRAAGNVLSRAGGAIGLVTVAYYGAITTIAKFALEVEQLANAAQLAGITYADLRNVSEQMARKGLSPELGGRILGALNQLGMQLQSLEGIHEWENRVLASQISLDPAQSDAYIRAMIEAKGWKEREVIVQNALRSIQRNGELRNMSEAEIKRAQKEFLIANQLPEEMAITGEIAGTTAEQAKTWGHLEESAKIWNEVTHKIIKSVNTILAILNADSMDADGPFFWMLKTTVNITGYIDTHLGEWIKYITEAAGILAKTFGGSEEGKGQEKPAEGLGDFMLPPAEPMGGGDMPLKLEKLIKAFREFNENIRSAAGTRSGAGAAQDRYASIGSMATPGLQLPPAAMAGDIYTDKYGIWPGGGAKPAGSDVGPGSGIGAGGGTGVGAGRFGTGVEAYPGQGRFRSAPRGRFTRGGLPLFPINQLPGGGGGAADGQDEPGGGHYEPPPKIPGDFREPGGSRRPGDRSYSSNIFTPDYLAGTEPSTNIQDVRTGSWGGAGGAGGTSQSLNLMPPGWHEPEKSVFVPGLDRPAPFYPPSTVTDPSLTSIGDLASVPFRLRRERQQFEPGSMRDALQRNPNLYRRDAEYTRRQIELRQQREAAELNEPDAFRLPTPAGPRSSPGDLIPPGMDRRVLDKGMGNELTGRLDGGIKLSVETNAPRGYQVDVEGKGIIDRTEMNRSAPPMEE